MTNSQLFNFTGGAGPLALAPENAAGTCLTVTSANILDQAPCNSGDANQAFKFGGGGAASVSATPTILAASSVSTALAIVAATSPAPANAQCNSVTTVFVTRAASSAVASTNQPVAASSPVSAPPASITQPVAASSSVPAPPQSAAQGGEVILPTDTANPSTPVPVSGAGVTLQPSSAAESHPRDNTATRAFTSVSLKASNGQCLFINPTAGDFRQNLIPVNLQPCTGSLNEKFDLITAGIHNNTPNSTLVVSSLVSRSVPVILHQRAKLIFDTDTGVHKFRSPPCSRHNSANILLRRSRRWYRSSLQLSTIPFWRRQFVASRSTQ